MAEATAVPTSALIDALAGAVDAPRDREGNLSRSGLPGFFKKWSKVAWGDLLDSLPAEEDAELGADAPAAEEFRRLVREAMLAEVILGDTGRGERMAASERRSLIDWCVRFAKPGPWRSIRSKKCWCRCHAESEGEIRLKVAIRHELFAQVSADKRLREMGPKAFARRAARYGVGTTSRDERPHGQSAIVLDADFVADLIAAIPPEDAETSP
jgi:hypothetical protein